MRHAHGKPTNRLRGSARGFFERLGSDEIDPPLDAARMVPFIFGQKVGDSAKVTP